MNQAASPELLSNHFDSRWFKHKSLGVRFETRYCDFRETIAVTKPAGITREQLAAAVKNMVEYHQTDIFPHLSPEAQALFIKKNGLYEQTMASILNSNVI